MFVNHVQSPRLEFVGSAEHTYILLLMGFCRTKKQIGPVKVNRPYSGLVYEAASHLRNAGTCVRYDSEGSSGPSCLATEIGVIIKYNHDYFIPGVEADYQLLFPRAILYQLWNSPFNDFKHHEISSELQTDDGAFEILTLLLLLLDVTEQDMESNWRMDHFKGVQQISFALSVIPWFRSPFLGVSLVFMLLYVWSREFPNANINIYGLVSLKAFYLPWAMLALDVIFGSKLQPDLLGIVAGHLYYFLTVLHPLAGGKNILKTPTWVQYSSGTDSTPNKRKYDDQTSLPSFGGAWRTTGFSAPIASQSLDSGNAPPSYNSVPPPVDDIQLAKQRAQEIAARLFNNAEAKRPRVENGSGFDSNDSKGFSYGSTDAAPKPMISNVAHSSIPVSYGYQGTSKKVDIPNGRVGVIIGKAGETIKYLQLQSGAKIQVTRDMDADPNSRTRMVELVGTPDQIAKAEQLIHDVLSEAGAGGRYVLRSGGRPRRDCRPPVKQND
ncbi:unnamed protein product [Camellia sinensis]